MKYVTLMPSNKKMQVNNIFCVGKNYAEHAKEMGGDVPTEPIIFLKPTSAIIADNESVILPKKSKNVHHEVELTILIGKRGRNIPPEKAMQYVAGYGVGLDITMRDIQNEAKKEGNPWTIAKGFYTSAPLSTFADAKIVSDPNNVEITLEVNGTIRQHSNTRNMIFSVAQLVAYISSIFSIEEGDIIYTGTPEGVAPIVAGDILDAKIKDVATLHTNVVSE